MQILHLTKKNYKTGVWSGGSTTELFIWPNGADYAKREFAIRVSSAKVDLEESDFTTLPKVTRYITPLTGGFTLTHTDGSTIVMDSLAKPYKFSGEIATHCVGKATDFNLMLKDTQGEMELCDNLWRLRVGFNCLYAVTDTTVKMENEYNLKAGELLVVFADKEFMAKVNASKNAIVCFAKI